MFIVTIPSKLFCCFVAVKPALCGSDLGSGMRRTQEFAALLSSISTKKQPCCVDLRKNSGGTFYQMDHIW